MGIPIWTGWPGCIMGCYIPGCIIMGCCIPGCIIMGYPFGSIIIGCYMGCPFGPIIIGC